MKLFITRKQAKGMFGGVKFEVIARVELLPEEAELVKKYGVEKEVLFSKDIKIGEQKTAKTGASIGILNFSVDVTIEGLMSGQTFKCKTIADILGYEAGVKEACEAFKYYLDAMKNFGGEEVVEYK